MNPQPVLIAGKWRAAAASGTFRADNPTTTQPLADEYPISSWSDGSSTSVTLAAGWKGGFIIPLFFMGAVTGQLIHAGAPGIDESVLMACLMVGFCVGVTKTPLGTTLVVTEMAGLTLLPVTLIAAVVSMGVTRSLGLIDTQRSRLDGADHAGA